MLGIHGYETFGSVEELVGSQERNYIFQSRFCFKGDSFISMSVGTDTGDKGQFTRPVHCKYITRKWTKYLGYTHPVHPRYFVHFLVMYLQCTGLVNWPLSPVRWSLGEPIGLR